MSNHNRVWCLVIFSAAILLLTAQCTKSPTNDDADIDKTPPEIIADLVVVSSTSYAATLQWTAPHDYRDDHSNGFVDGYDIRISYDSVTSQNFQQAYHYDSVPSPAPAGLLQQCQIDNLEPDSLYYFAIKSRDDKGNWSGISNCCHIHCPAIQIVAFADTALERIIREHVHKPTGDILSSDVDTITILLASHYGIKSLTGLEYCTSLQAATLAGNGFSDISPLAGAAHLWGLDLAQNNIVDLSPLAGMTDLRQLHIGENPITDIGPLAQVPGLGQLFMFATQVTDFSPLYGLEHLEDIHLALLNLTDIGFIRNLTHLRICKLNSNSIVTIEPLSDLANMEHLDLMYNQIVDLSPLSTLVNLTTINLEYNSITDIQPLVDNTGIGSGDTIYLNGNALSQQAIDVEIPALEARGVVVLR